MAEFKLDPKEIMMGLTITIDTREMFGRGHWRLKFAVPLVRLAAKILGCGVEVIPRSAPTTSVMRERAFGLDCAATICREYAHSSGSGVMRRQVAYACERRISAAAEELSARAEKLRKAEKP